MRGSKRRAAAVSTAAEKAQPVVGETIPDAANRKGIRSCVECGATSTPQWREGPMGPKTLCNACGVRRQRMLRKQQSGSARSAPTAPVAAVQARRRNASRAAAKVPAMLADDDFHYPGLGSASEHSSEETELHWNAATAPHPASSPSLAAFRPRTLPSHLHPPPQQLSDQLTKQQQRQQQLHDLLHLRQSEEQEQQQPQLVRQHSQEVDADSSCNEEESAAYDLLFFAGLGCGGGYRSSGSGDVRPEHEGDEILEGAEEEEVVDDVDAAAGGSGCGGGAWVHSWQPLPRRLCSLGNDLDYPYLHHWEQQQQQQQQQHGHNTRRHLQPPVRRSDDFYYYDGGGEMLWAGGAGAGAHGSGSGSGNDGSVGGYIKRRKVVSSPAMRLKEARMLPRGPSFSSSEDAADSRPGAPLLPAPGPGPWLTSSRPCIPPSGILLASPAPLAATSSDFLRHHHRHPCQYSQLQEPHQGERQQEQQQLQQHPLLESRGSETPAAPAEIIPTATATRSHTTTTASGNSASAPAGSAGSATNAVLPSLPPLLTLSLPLGSLPVLPLSLSLPSVSAQDLEVVARLQLELQRACAQLQRANVACEEVGVVVAEQREVAASAHEAAAAASQQLADGVRAMADQYRLRDVLSELRGAMAAGGPGASASGASRATTGEALPAGGGVAGLE